MTTILVACVDQSTSRLSSATLASKVDIISKKCDLLQLLEPRCCRVHIDLIKYYKGGNITYAYKKDKRTKTCGLGHSPAVIRRAEPLRRIAAPVGTLTESLIAPDDAGFFLYKNYKKYLRREDCEVHNSACMPKID